MKKTVLLLWAGLAAAQVLTAQLAEGIKFLNYEKNKSAKTALQKAYDANPKDGQNIYWLGQAMLAGDGFVSTPQDLADAKALYQKGLQELGSDPWLLVGMGHIEILEGGDLNAAKQKFEQAITATTETKGKNKGNANPGILNAIGRANADGSSKLGDPIYGIEKLKKAGAIDLTNPDIFVNMGINYQKLGGENGGEAVKAYQEALARDPKNALALYRTGRIYQSQNNKELFEEFYDKTIAADPAFPRVYYAYYNYYSNRDVSKAKDYLDKYVATADPDPRNDIFLADYLFRAGRYTESLEKTAALDKSFGLEKLPRLGVLYAYNNDRLGDSLKARQYIDGFLSKAPEAEKLASDYELGAAINAKFPDGLNNASQYVEKALVLDTIKANQITLMGKVADYFGKNKAYGEQLKWMKRQVEARGTPPSEADYYRMTNAAFTSKDYAQTMELAKPYMQAFPDKPQPFSFFRRAALATDPDSTKGTALEALEYQNTLYANDLAKNKTKIYQNQIYALVFYINKYNALQKDPDFKVKSDGSRTAVVDQCIAAAQKAVETCDKMLQLYPEPTDEVNKLATDQKAKAQKVIDYYSKAGNKTAGPAKSHP